MKAKPQKKLSQGYIALTSVIIISLLLITITAALSLVNYYSRYNVLESEYKTRSSALAESCVDYAFSKIIANPSYSGNNEIVNIGADKCKVISVSPTASFPKTVITQAVFQNSYTNLKIVADSGFHIQSWQECPNIPSAVCP